MLQWGERNERRRGEVAKLFETYKQNNPYASAADYNQYLEQVVGPKDFFIRGSLPAQDIIERMGNDNQEKKRRDDYGKNLDFAAKNMAVNNQIQQYIEDNMMNMTEAELQNSLTGILSNGDSQYEFESRKSATDNIGNYQQRRDKKVKKMYDDVLQKGLSMLKETDGAADISGLFDDENFKDFNQGELSQYQAQLKKQFSDEQTRLKDNQNQLKEDQNRQRTVMFHNLKKEYMSDTFRQNQLAAGGKGYAAVRANIIEDLQMADIGSQETPEEIERMADIIMKEMQLRRDGNIEAENIKGKLEATDQAFLDITNQAKAVTSYLQATLNDVDDTKKGAARLAIADLDLTTQQAASLAAFIRGNEFSSPAEGYNKWRQSLSEIENAQLRNISDQRTRAKKLAADQYPDQETVIDYVEDFQLQLAQWGKKMETTFTGIQSMLTSGVVVDKKTATGNLEKMKVSLQNNYETLEKEIELRLRNPERWIKGSEPFLESTAQSQLLDPLKSQTEILIARIDALLRKKVEVTTTDVEVKTTDVDAGKGNPSSLTGAEPPTEEDIMARVTAILSEKGINKDEMAGRKRAYMVANLKTQVREEMQAAWDQANPRVISRRIR